MTVPPNSNYTEEERALIQDTINKLVKQEETALEMLRDAQRRLREIGLHMASRVGVSRLDQSTAALLDDAERKLASCAVAGNKEKTKRAKNKNKGKGKTGDGDKGGAKDDSARKASG